MREVLDLLDKVGRILRKTSPRHGLVDTLDRVHDAVDAMLGRQLQDWGEGVLRSLDVARRDPRDRQVGVRTGLVTELPIIVF